MAVRIKMTQIDITYVGILKRQKSSVLRRFLSYSEFINYKNSNF